VPAAVRRHDASLYRPGTFRLPKTPKSPKQDRAPTLAQLSKRSARSLEPLKEIIKSGSDMSAAILASSHVDHALELAISDLFIGSARDKDSLLFEGSAPLASMRAKINLCYSLGIIGEATRHDAGIIANVRNAFAHSRSEVYFSDEPIKTDCLNLKCLREVDYYQKFRLDGEPIVASDDPRKAFGRTCIVLHTGLSKCQYVTVGGLLEAPTLNLSEPRLP